MNISFENEAIDEVSITEKLDNVLKKFNDTNETFVKTMEEQILLEIENISENYSGFLSDNIKSIMLSLKSYLNQIKKCSESIIRFCEKFSEIAEEYKSELDKILPLPENGNNLESCIHFINHDDFSAKIELNKSFKKDVKKIEDTKYKKIHMITSALLLLNSECVKTTIKGSFINSQSSFIQLTDINKLEKTPVLGKFNNLESINSFLKQFIHIIFIDILNNKHLDSYSNIEKFSQEENLCSYIFEEFQGSKRKATLKNNSNILLLTNLINNVVKNFLTNDLFSKDTFKEIIKFTKMIRISENVQSPSKEIYLVDKLITTNFWQNYINLFKIVKLVINIKYKSVISAKENPNMLNNYSLNSEERSANSNNSPRTSIRIEKKRFAFCEFIELLNLFFEMGLNGKIIDELIKSVGKKYDFSFDKVRDFICDNFYHTFSPNKCFIEAMKIKQLNLSKISKSRKHIFILKNTICFLDPNVIEKLNNFSFIPGNILKKTVYKSLRKGFSAKDFLKNWNSYFDLDSLKNEFSDFKEENENSKLKEEIKMDIERSFHFYSHRQEMMTKLLYVYLSLRPKESYCQGMNFLAGFLVLIAKKKSLALKLFSCLMEKEKFIKVFENDVILIHQLIFQLTNIIPFYLPRLSKHFKNEKISINDFVTPWLISLFTYILQYQNYDSHIPSSLCFIINEFVYGGWRSILKIIILILKQNEEYLITLMGEEILTWFMGLPKSDYYTKKFIKFQDANKMCLSSTFMKLLEEKYNEINKVAQDFNIINK